MLAFFFCFSICLSIFSLFLPVLFLLTPLKHFLWVCHTPFLSPFTSILQQQYLVLFTSTNLISPSLSFYLTPSLYPSLLESVISSFNFDIFLSLRPLLYPANFFAFKSSSSYRCFSLFIFFLSHLYVTTSFLHSLSLCLCLCLCFSNYL